MIDKSVGWTSLSLRACNLLDRVTVLPFFREHAQHLTDNTRDVNLTTNYCILLRICSLKMSCENAEMAFLSS